MKFTLFCLIGFTLFGWASPVVAGISRGELRAILGNHDNVVWSVDNLQNWSVADDRLVLTSPARDAVHYLEAVVNGPGVMELRPAVFSTGRLEGSIFVNGVQSGGKLSSFTNNRVQIGEGTHTIRLQLKNITLVHLQPAVFELYPAQWGRYTALPLQTAGVSAGAVTLTGDWIGQDRVHRGDGSAAWSGIHLLGLSSEPVVEPVMRAEFSGAGVLSYYSLAGGLSAGDWHRVVQRMEEGDHAIEWKPASGNTNHRQDRDLVIDEIRFTPEVPLAVALDTPEWIWEGIDGGEGRPFGAENPTAKGGATVILPNRSSISTQLPKEGMLRIRYKGSVRSITVGGESVSVYGLTKDPEGAGSDFGGGLILIPPGGGLLQISTLWGSEVDSVEWIPPPPSIAATLDMPDIITSGGTGTWAPVAAGRLGQYVVEWTASEFPGEGWLEWPVTGPAEVTVASSQTSEFLVNGHRVWVGGSSSGVTIEIPVGTHLLRCVGRASVHSSSKPQITAMAIKPLATEGKLGAAMDHPAAWASLGAWKSSGALTYDGVDALRPDPPPNSLKPPFSPSTSNHILQAPVSGPGYVSFMTYVQRSPEVSHGTSIQLQSNLHSTVFRRLNDEPQGWLRHRVWYPPGEHWIRWRVSGTEHELSLVALAQFSFAASETLAFDEVVGSVEGIWANNPDRPWSGVRKEAGDDAFIISPMIGPDEPTRLSLEVEGPGELHFHWSNGAKRSTEGELWINGVKTSQNLPWQEEGKAVTVFVPSDGPVVFDWLFKARFEGNWAAMKDVVWIPWPEVSLAEALDAPEEVTWETSSALPFKGRPDSGARNGSAAQVGLMPGEETWLEATVTGSGLFDFWLRGVPGALNDPRVVAWELFIDGVKSHIHPTATTWPAQWVLGEGTHKIRLVFRNTTGAEGPAFIAVDDVSWEPLVPATGEEGWTASHPEMLNGFTEGGFEDGPQYVIPAATGDVRWIEKSITGPGVLAWDARLTRGGTTHFRRQVLVNGISALPLGSISSWDSNRLHIPEGEHTVRWTCEPSFSSDAPYPTRADAIWQISNVTFTPGFSPLMQGIDDDEMFWLEVGGSEGSLVGAEESYDGEDAWALGSGTVLYLCNTKPQGVKARGMVFGNHSSGLPSWFSIFRWAGPGELVEWIRSSPPMYPNYHYKSFVDQFTMEKIDVIPFAEAVDADEEFTVNRWIGLAEAGEAFDGIDAAWSFLNRSFGSNTASMTLSGPAKIRFRWRASGNGSLGLRVNGAWFPVPDPEFDWREVEFEVYAPSLIEWVHASTPQTNTTAVGEAWLDSILIESRPHRTITEAVGDGPGLVFENTPESTGANQWRAVAFRDANGVWQQSARGITGAAGLQTTVTGPVMLSFRSFIAGLNIPPPVENAMGNDTLASQSVIIIGAPGVNTIQRFLSVSVGGAEKLWIDSHGDDGWRDHLVHVPAGEHRVVWQLSGVMDFGYPMPELQAWVSGVTLSSPRAHYEAWADLYLEGLAAREPGDDADGNGVINFMEYAYGSDPGDEFSKPPEMFGFVRTARGFASGSAPGEEYVLHVPRPPSHVSTVLEMSADLVTWTPSPIPLRSVPSTRPNSWIIDGRDHDSGPYQVIPFEIDSEQPANYFRITFALPEDDG